MCVCVSVCEIHTSRDVLMDVFSWTAGGSSTSTSEQKGSSSTESACSPCSPGTVQRSRNMNAGLRRVCVCVCSDGTVQSVLISLICWLDFSTGQVLIKQHVKVHM